ncbi:ATP-binding cassette domain-containing protein, partial [Providencia stuartii]|uniref:ATP-binding cassette domain-containing protein n=1 Tax=Providencia stuartii TaxID=588 RepID=UPI002989F254
CNPAYSKSIQTWLRFGEIMRGSLRVMSGLLSPTSGNIYINDINVDTIGLNNYRDRIACVLQDDKLFSGTIAENISSFESVKDDKRIVECAILSNIHEEIMKMPMGYETMLSELGGSLSGGQKQRLMIARALYKQPSILFLDEATSHLDLKNEAYINQSISSLKITRIIIAHRESTIASVDRVLNPWEAIAKLERRSQRDVSKIND